MTDKNIKLAKSALAKLKAAAGMLEDALRQSSRDLTKFDTSVNAALGYADEAVAEMEKMGGTHGR